jgi:hypothetical protein
VFQNNTEMTSIAAAAMATGRRNLTTLSLATACPALSGKETVPVGGWGFGSDLQSSMLTAQSVAEAAWSKSSSSFGNAADGFMQRLYLCQTFRTGRQMRGRLRPQVDGATMSRVDAAGYAVLEKIRERKLPARQFALNVGLGGKLRQQLLSTFVQYLPAVRTGA